MKKTRRNPDGTEDVLEGDPGEIREYERQIQTDEAEIRHQREQPMNESPKKPGILHGAEVDGVPLTENEVEWVRWLRKFNTGGLDLKPVKSDPIWITSCSICGRVGCQGGCWYLPYTWCAAGTKLTLLQQEDGSSRQSHSLVDVLMGLTSVEVKTNGN